MTIRSQQAQKRTHAAAGLGLLRTICTEDVAFASDLRAIWPTLPMEWCHVETYCAPAFMGDPDVQMFQAWLCGETGELLIQLTMAGDETPIMNFALTPAPEIQHVRLYPQGGGPSRQDMDKVSAAIHALHLRHGVPAPGVH